MKKMVVGNCPICGAPIYGLPNPDTAYASDYDCAKKPLRTCTCTDFTGVNRFLGGKKDYAAEAIGSVAEIVAGLSPADRKKLLDMGDALVEKLRKIYNG
jgi:hypothetical protein